MNPLNEGEDISSQLNAIFRRPVQCHELDPINVTLRHPYFTTIKDLTEVMQYALQKRGVQVWSRPKITSICWNSFNIIPFIYKGSLYILKLSLFHRDKLGSSKVFPEEFDYLSSEGSLWLFATESRNVKKRGELGRHARNSPYQVILLDHESIPSVINGYILQKLPLSEGSHRYRVTYPGITRQVRQKRSYTVQEFLEGKVADLVLESIGPYFSGITPFTSDDPLVTSTSVRDKPAYTKRTFPETALISTVGYHPDPIIAAARAVNGQELLVLHDFSEGGSAQVAPIHKIRQALPIQGGTFATCGRDLNSIIGSLRKYIQKMNDLNYNVALQVGTGSQRLTAALLFAAYLEYKSVNKILYSDEITPTSVELPLFPIPSAINLQSFPKSTAQKLTDLLIPPLTRLPSAKRLVTTVGSDPEPVIRAIQMSKTERVAVLHNFSDEQIGPLLDTIRMVTQAKLRPTSVNQLDIYDTIRLVCNLIRQESDMSRRSQWNVTPSDSFQRIFLHLGGGAQKLVTATILASFLCYDRIRAFFYFPFNESNPVHLPILPWNQEKIEKYLPHVGTNPIEYLVKKSRALQI